MIPTWVTKLQLPELTVKLRDTPTTSKLKCKHYYGDFKIPFHTNPKCGVRSAPPYSVGIPLSFGGFIHSIYPWLKYCSLGHVIWATGCRDMINLKQQYHGKSFFTLELKMVFGYY